MTNADTLSPMVVDGQASMSVSPLPRGTLAGITATAQHANVAWPYRQTRCFALLRLGRVVSGQTRCAATDIKEALKLAGAIVAASGSRIRVARMAV